MKNQKCPPPFRPARSSARPSPMSSRASTPSTCTREYVESQQAKTLVFAIPTCTHRSYSRRSNPDLRNKTNKQVSTWRQWTENTAIILLAPKPFLCGLEYIYRKGRDETCLLLRVCGGTIIRRSQETKTKKEELVL